LPVYRLKEFDILAPIPAILSSREDQIDRTIAERDQERVISYVLRYCDGILVGGTTGHGPALTNNQFSTLLRLSLLIKKSRFPDRRVLVGAIETSAGRIREKIYRSTQIEKDLGCKIDGVVVPPQAFFYLQSPLEYVRTMVDLCEYAQRFNKMIYLHNLPRAGLLLGPAEVAELKKIENVIGIKDSSGEESLLEELLKLQDARFGVYQGDPQFSMKALDHGARGIVDANASFAPSLVREMADQFFAGAREEALRIHNRVLNSTRYLDQKDPWIEEIRLASRPCALYLLGVIEHLPWPLMESSLRHIAEGLITNGIPKADATEAGVTASTAFTAVDLETRIERLYALGYARDLEGRLFPKGSKMEQDRERRM
jgi:4-hydroxy-tetrahydrodipicolinate synthase